MCLERVVDLQHFSALVQQVKRQHPAVRSNCYLLPEAITRCAGQGRLYYERLESGSAFLCAEGSYYHLYYYVEGDRPFCYNPKDKPVIIETVYKAAERQANQSEPFSQWTANGFVLHKTSRQFMLNPLPAREQLAEQLAQAKARLHDAGFELATAGAAQLTEVQALWAGALDPFDFTYLSDEELRCELDQGRVSCVADACGSLCAVLLIIFERGASNCRHLVTGAAYRRSVGMGTALVLDWLVKAAAQGKSKCLAWIDQTNIPSLNLFAKLGFQATGRLSDQLLLAQKGV
ncbi:MAG: GNAT family N-acetyltransferase [Chloroflexi bacterium]|nr:GNAT family N-acetyltransferase [Chloroflexota bacterium]